MCPYVSCTICRAGRRTARRVGYRGKNDRIFSFTASWNELLYSIAFLSGDQNKMLTNGVVAAFVAGDYYSWGPLMAGALLASIPVAILYTFFLDRFIAGFTMGAVK